MTVETALPILSNSINEETKPTVDLRNIHAWLEVKSKFADWIKNRINDYGFMQDVDFTTILKIGKRDKNNNLGTTAKEYHATLNMAKELCMVERNAKGREARKYFIECERIALSTTKALTPSEIILAQATQLVKFEREQTRQAAKIDQLEDDIFLLKSETRYFTITAFCRVNNITFPLNELNKCGRRAANICRKSGLTIGRVPDERFGKVNSYPEKILAHVFKVVDLS